ncbi:hypothetical protein CRE_19732 [Caenorhabditis remanei]|uniref:F-box domain-containing protein n=1 Tax=Caenorhabditis remanei TaxID=31234 RepID=E3MTI1_CAERE|nr:hypothetical protein CRE_19732 [Caenorhabditis remanei]
MSTTSALEFSNLPTDTIGKIIEKCDLKEQLTLRKVSKDLRSLVDKQKIAYKSITIYLTDSYISCVYNDKDVVYASENWDKNEMPIETSIISNDDYVKIALNDLSIALKNPKLRLDDLYLTVYNSPDEEETLKIGHQKKERKESEKYRVWSNGSKQLTAGYYFGFFPSEFLMHFKRFVIYKWRVDKDFLMNLRALFSTSINFDSCTVESNEGENGSEYLESFCEKVGSGRDVIYCYKIPDDSNKMLEFKLYGCQMIIEKKNF